MSCPDCDQARINEHYRTYDLKCVYCGARYMRWLRRWPPTFSRDKRKEWRDKVLADWTEYGHDPKLLLDLESGEGLPYAPKEKR